MDTSTMEELQTAEQRNILDTITQLRKCGLDTILSLPQLVVCGDQSAGKSSLLEALTEIPFPRNDSLCTRFATEINLRCEPTEKLTIKVIPDSSLLADDKSTMEAFSTAISNFEELPSIMNAAKTVMGIAEIESTPGPAFSKAILRIDVEGPTRPHLTLVDIPGLIQSTTKGVTEADIETVAAITDHYIQQSRTICLAVISAQNDVANQGILRKVRKFDPEGKRTLGIITKPDKLPSGSKLEAEFLELAKNENVPLKLGWQVVKNRAYEESDFTAEQRAISEKAFFKDSVWESLNNDHVGVDNLRVRLSHLLLEHGKTELPRLSDDLEAFLQKSKDEIALLGDPRVTISECRTYLAQLSMACYDICKAGVQGIYEKEFFRLGWEEPFSLKYESSTRRLRAVVQFMNSGFAQEMRERGHKYKIGVSNGEAGGGYSSEKGGLFDEKTISDELARNALHSLGDKTVVLSKKDAMVWVRNRVLKSRGTELAGSFNPSVVAELFWEQSESWEGLAKSHVEGILQLCENFLRDILATHTTADVKDRFWRFLLVDELRKQRTSAFDELDQLIQDKNEYLVNYNHYFTDNLQRRRQQKAKEQLQGIFPEQLAPSKCNMGFHYARYDVANAFDKVVSALSQRTTADMDDFSCEEALDRLVSIYKVQEKVFVANVTTQVVERHVMKNLKDIFSPLRVINLPDSKITSIVLEPSSTKRQRLLLQDRIKRLEEGREIFRSAIRSSATSS
ncbi:interferon-induced GTP-binding protein Mx [Nemania sp. FL0031]|nr:interferon-induced GTP-binding protein Mx [Nemania sp. FL0031]